MFKRRRFPVEIILVCVRWYCKYGISYRDLTEMMQERGVEVDPSTIMRWVHRFAPELEKRVRWYQGYRATSWRVDETYVKVGGKWKYLFRAVDKYGRLIDFMLSDRRNTHAAHRFLGKALTTMRHWPPSSITTDQLGSYPKAIGRLQREGKLSGSTKHRTCKYLNNIIEADHGALKRVIRPTRGFHTMKTASATIKGFEVMRMIKTGPLPHMQIACQGRSAICQQAVRRLHDRRLIKPRKSELRHNSVNATEPEDDIEVATHHIMWNYTVGLWPQPCQGRRQSNRPQLLLWRR